MASGSGVDAQLAKGGPGVQTGLDDAVGFRHGEINAGRVWHGGAVLRSLVLLAIGELVRVDGHGRDMVRGGADGR